MTKQPTAEQLDAVRAYAAEHGRNWKDALRTDWLYARHPGALQQVRNEFGTKWLEKFKLSPQTGYNGGGRRPTMTLKLHQDYQNGFHNLYGLPSIPDGLFVRPTTDAEREDKTRVKWSGKSLTLPKVGDRIKVTMNGIGHGTVLGYFIEYGWLGLHVKPEVQPDWLVKQERERKRKATFYPNQVLVFGTEVAA